MSNMSYCRFENTLEDLRDCLEALEDGALDRIDMSDIERESALELIDLCGEIYNGFSDEAEETEDDEDDEDDENIVMEYIYNSEDKNK